MRIFRTCTRLIALQMILILFQSCSQLLISDFTLTDFFYDEERLFFTFSSDLDSEKIKKAFAFTENNKVVRGTFSIYENQMIFTPQGGIKENCDYEVTISSYAEDTNGKSLKEKFIYKFSTKQDSLNPEITYFYPNGEDIPEDGLDHLEIIFSKAIKKESFYNAYAIEPPISHQVVFNDDRNEVKIIFDNPVCNGITYNFRISTDLMDVYDNYLLESYSTNFKSGGDNIPPSFTLNYTNDSNTSVELNEEPDENHNLPCSLELNLNFSEKINMDYIGSYIEIFPSSIKYTYEADKINETSVLLKLSGKYNSKCNIKIKRGIEDKYGNKTNSDRKYLLQFDNEICRPVSFKKAFLLIDGMETYKELSYETQYSHINLDPEYFGNDKTSRKTSMYLVFNVSGKSDGLDFFTVLDALSFKYTNSCCTILIKKAELVPLAQVDFLLTENEINENNYSIIKYVLEIQNTNKAGLIEMIISSSVKDLIGNIYWKC